MTGIINDTVTMAQAFMGQIGGPQDLHGADKSRATAYFRRGTKVNEADNHSFRMRTPPLQLIEVCPIGAWRCPSRPLGNSAYMSSQTCTCLTLHRASRGTAGSIIRSPVRKARHGSYTIFIVKATAQTIARINSDSLCIINLKGVLGNGI